MTRLTSISVTDFRSIRGSIVVPLDAPVVLIHGQNGAGKTSLLSAIELGLTGQVPSLARVDPDYIGHLVHKEAETSRIQISGSGLAQPRSDTELRVSRTQITGAPLIDEVSARFYSERCFLAQATLGRLLEIYEDKDTRKSDSTLTRFVKDLLGLDHLDALIDGLHDAGDVRRFRSTVPAYWEARENIPALSKELERVRPELVSLDEAETATSSTIGEALATLSIEPGMLLEIEVLRDRLGRTSEEPELQRLAGLRRNVGAVEQQWKSIAGGSGEVRSQAETRASESAAALEAWRAGPGAVLEQTVARGTALFPSQQIASDGGPVSQHQVLIRSVGAELDRLRKLLEESAGDDTKLAAFNQDIERAQARVNILEKQIAEHTENAGQLAKTLSEVLPHVHSDDCPVCGRDFSEVSGVDLRAHVAARIGDLTERASSLQALSRERVQTVSALTDAVRQRDTLASQRLDPKLRDEAKTREAQLAELSRSLADLNPVAESGQKLTEDAVVASKNLVAFQSRDLQGESIRETLAGLAETLGVNVPADNVGVADIVDRFNESISAKTTELEKRLSARRLAVSQLRELENVRARRAALKQETKSIESRISALTENKEAAEKIILDARELAKRARDTRTDIVRRVFNDSLNAIWRDLFVRLAPEEPFVPAFALPENASGAVEAVLETHYRSGGRGGNPRAMLSAGNLNTAALTLFLSLHLSVAPVLPWLVIDDPVQSMDEVHIAQFAALLRTLSKGHNRQIIIAVHEKQLFDYLALELAPAFQDDRLITIELSRGADGATLMSYNPIVWHPDTAIAA
ncbi:AAA family ATPase [Luteimonas kalidii]|uniref:AAA family ATPase n=1 Tax=Luteimonas kalidii TaxID=3042025 RepID=A0ABT6JXA0_9GAMM|nr:AAA family ATPase [Luteimonas kalidii]MDH5835329.1 AAA family ATPase [Luteimonas kalidii]